MSGPLTDAQAAELLEQARGAIIDQDYPRAIDVTTRILAAPPRAETAEARELLGLARERSGQVTQAVAEYQRYLADYPDGDGALRVRQRLAALTTAREQPKESIRGQAAARDSAWDVYGGISQFYRRDSIDFGGESGLGGSVRHLLRCGGRRPPHRRALRFRVAGQPLATPTTCPAATTIPTTRRGSTTCTWT